MPVNFHTNADNTEFGLLKDSLNSIEGTCDQQKSLKETETKMVFILEIKKPAEISRTHNKSRKLGDFDTHMIY